MAAVAARWVRGKRRPVWAVWHGPRLSGALRPGGEAASRPGRGGSAAEGGGGSWEIRDLRFLPVAGGYFWARVFFFFFLSFFRPLPPFVEDTDVFTFADHLLRAPSVQLLKLSLHVTRLSRCEASSNPWRV